MMIDTYLVIEPEITRNKTFNLAYNVYVPRGTFQKDDFPKWLIRCGCTVMVGADELKIYDRVSRQQVESPENLLLWLLEQWTVNREIEASRVNQSGSQVELGYMYQHPEAPSSLLGLS